VEVASYVMHLIWPGYHSFAESEQAVLPDNDMISRGDIQTTVYNT